MELRWRVQAGLNTGESGLNKGEARNVMTPTVFFNRLGEIRGWGFQQERYRVSGLNLVTAADGLWKTVYTERAVSALQEHGQVAD